MELSILATLPYTRLKPLRPTNDHMMERLQPRVERAMEVRRFGVPVVVGGRLPRMRIPR
jgi:hypothetical protein